MRLLVLLVLLLLTPSALAAWTIGTGTTISQPGTLFTVGSVITVPVDAELTFTTDARQAPVLDGIVLDMVPDSGEWAWSILSWTQANISVGGNNLQAGAMHVAGLEEVSYSVLGVIGTPTFTKIGPEFTFDVPPGEQVIYILPATSSDASLKLDAGYSWANGTITAVVSLKGSSGGAAGGEASNINVSVFLPNGETAYINLTETSRVGVYAGALNVTMSPPPAPYVVTAQFGELSDGVVVIVTENLHKDFQSIGVETPVNVTLSQSGAAEHVPMLAFLVVIIACLVLSAKFMPFFGYVGMLLGVVATFVAISGSYLQVYRWLFIALTLLSFVVAWRSQMED